MYTLVIVGIVIMVVGFIYAKVVYKSFFEIHPYILPIALIVVLLGLFNLFYTDASVPSEYNEIENYSYVTKTGILATIDGPFYEKDGMLYEINTYGKSAWIPFYPAEMVEAELPENYSSEVALKE